MIVHPSGDALSRLARSEEQPVGLQQPRRAGYPGGSTPLGKPQLSRRQLYQDTFVTYAPKESVRRCVATHIAWDGTDRDDMSNPGAPKSIPLRRPTVGQKR